MKWMKQLLECKLSYRPLFDKVVWLEIKCGMLHYWVMSRRARINKWNRTRNRRYASFLHPYHNHLFYRQIANTYHHAISKLAYDRVASCQEAIACKYRLGISVDDSPDVVIGKPEAVICIIKWWLACASLSTSPSRYMARPRAAICRWNERRAVMHLFALVVSLIYCATSAASSRHELFYLYDQELFRWPVSLNLMLSSPLRWCHFVTIYCHEIIILSLKYGSSWFASFSHYIFCGSYGKSNL